MTKTATHRMRLEDGVVLPLVMEEGSYKPQGWAASGSHKEKGKNSALETLEGTDSPMDPE